MLLYIFFFSLDIEINELDMLISQLPKSDLNAHEYLYIEDEMPEGGLTDREIIDAMLNTNKEEEHMIGEDESISLYWKKLV